MTYLRKLLERVAQDRKAGRQREVDSKIALGRRRALRAKPWQEPARITFAPRAGWPFSLKEGRE